MIVTKTYINKSNTIVKDSIVNTGLNPILELNYGDILTRGLIYFDHNKIKKLYEDKTYPELSKMKHILKMTNVSSLISNNENLIEGCSSKIVDYNKQRAVSFDIILFLIPEKWDSGRGYDYVADLNQINKRGYSSEGSNWYFRETNKKWKTEGIYDDTKLSRELDLFTNKEGNKSKVIIAYEHFDYGNEMINIDITDTVNKFITGEIENNGIGIAFSPLYEETKNKPTQYVAFFTQHTNGFYEPFIETSYNEDINDCRDNFYLNKPNKLYFYCSIKGDFVNLDELPICEINGLKYAVKQATKGIYYIDVEFDNNDYEIDTMYHDIWSNIKYNGKEFPDVELDFVTKSDKSYYSFGLPLDKEDKEVVPTIYGINEKEKIKSGDIRKVNIELLEPYTNNSNNNYSGGIEYRVYIKDGMNRQVDVIPYRNVEHGYNENYFIINTAELLPAKYAIDIRIKNNYELIYHRDLIEFDIVNDISKIYN